MADNYEDLKKQFDEGRAKKARKTADAIIRDMTDRSGGDHWFESCDEEIQTEIRDAWAAIIDKTFR